MVRRDDDGVGARDGLLSVDLATGEVTTVAGDVGGQPANPVRLGDCVYGAWAGATGAVVTACGGEEGVPQSLDAATSDLVFRVKESVPLTKYDRSVFYTPKTPVGYVDYPHSQQYLKAMAKV